MFTRSDSVAESAVNFNPILYKASGDIRTSAWLTALAPTFCAAVELVGLLQTIMTSPIPPAPCFHPRYTDVDSGVLLAHPIQLTQAPLIYLL
jgi:hypothetical protein